MEVRIKQATDEKTYQDALSIRRKVFIEEQNVSEEEEVDEHENEAVHFTAYDGNIPIGAGRFRVVDGVGKLERICVLPEYRRKNVGKQIIRYIEAFAKNQNIPSLKLGAQTHARPFYESLGYHVASDLFYDAGIPHVMMKKTLTDII